MEDQESEAQQETRNFESTDLVSTKGFENDMGPWMHQNDHTAV